jgi:plasmid stabilization system protein ParE
MRCFAVLWTRRASLQVLRARTFLGPVRAADLDQELESVRERLEALPEVGAPVLRRGTWDLTLRRVILARTPFHVYYRLDIEQQNIEIVSLWHEKQRPPRW